MFADPAYGQLTGNLVWPESALSVPCQWLRQSRVDSDHHVAAEERELLELDSLGFHPKSATY